MAAIKATAISLIAAALLINAAAAAGGAYANHTVGAAAGWFFNSTSNRSSTDYTAWAAAQTFNLGDYLIFNTDTNQTVVQTYNMTTYRSCTVDDSLDTDTFQYDGDNDEFGNSTIVFVPLTVEGTQYYFSGAEDGEQCANGMAFEIKVGHGLGLPPSLNRPPPPAYVPPPAASEEGQSPPVMVGASNPPRSGGVRSVRCSGDLCKLVFVVLVLASFLA